PKEDTQLQSMVSGVRIFVDDQFFAVMKAEIYGPDKDHLKTLSILEFKKDGESGEAYPKSVDVRNEVTRDKTRFQVMDAELKIGLPEKVFQVEGLEQSILDLRSRKVEGMEL
ncbi:MAG: outer membrane lipoprotein-sorting protein, partial [Verrucomicrobiota bacterium]